MQLSSLRGRKTVERVRHKGQCFRGQHMHVTYILGASRRGVARYAPTGLFVGTAASTKLDKSAVKRNRMRRRCREALRLAVKPEKTLPLCQLIIVPRSSSLQCDFEELLKDAKAFLSHLQRHKSIISNQ
ncbi:ribonuclease P protein component [Candidatus Kaiserbacteria bacterium RIFCSPLOWO2_12_FULL_53_8]|uniref:Ribonuclease P protein component n=1 Tax=Candidatus Kaiserbacteria bacterium RIFCSPLOWO2_12_FULL_53_8 TaxID=1798529 RepID=A0A1F6FZK4_9BACT|nr:MAG: ribonuclease P protein component [Candidatus Kaiserbacteria bacterium RIFCSPLOWO2_12_FULL_53_8]